MDVSAPVLHLCLVSFFLIQFSLCRRTQITRSTRIDSLLLLSNQFMHIFVFRLNLLQFSNSQDANNRNYSLDALFVGCQKLNWRLLRQSKRTEWSYLYCVALGTPILKQFGRFVCEEWITFVRRKKTKSINSLESNTQHLRIIRSRGNKWQTECSRILRVKRIPLINIGQVSSGKSHRNEIIPQQYFSSFNLWW